MCYSLESPTEIHLYPYIVLSLPIFMAKNLSMQLTERRRSTDNVSVKNTHKQTQNPNTPKTMKIMTTTTVPGGGQELHVDQLGEDAQLGFGVRCRQIQSDVAGRRRRRHHPRRVGQEEVVPDNGELVLEDAILNHFF